MNLFKGLIKCKCGKNFNFKNDHGNLIYLCSRYKNYTAKACPRNVLRELDLIHLIKLHLSTASLASHKTLILTEEIIRAHVDKIEVDGESIIIFYKDKTKTEWTNSHLLI